MHAVATTPKKTTSRLGIVVLQNGQAKSARLLNLQRDYPPLGKEVAWRAIGAHPERAGQPWTLSAQVAFASPAAAVARLTACAADGELLTVLDIPTANFAWMALSLAQAAGLTGEWQYGLWSPQGDMPVPVEDLLEQDFEILPEAPAPLQLPSRFETCGAPASRPVRADAPDSWIRCLFSPSAFDHFRSAAAAEQSRERHWVGLGRVFPTPSACSVQVEELIEIPADAAGAGWIFTSGRAWRRLHGRLGLRLVAYLHLHPATVQERPLAPSPSSNDSVLAWDFDQSTRNPCVFPIALFGAGNSPATDTLAAHGYDHGLLTRIPLEVIDER